MVTTSLTAQTQVSFPFAGKLKIERAEYYFDGGSVSVVILDSKGNRGYVHYAPKSWTDMPNRDKLTFILKPKDKGTILARGSDDEKRLLKYIREACIASFGSSDPTILKKPSSELRGPNAKGDYFVRMAMGALLAKFPVKSQEQDFENEILRLLESRRKVLISGGLGAGHPDIVKIDNLIKLVKE